MNRIDRMNRICRLRRLVQRSIGYYPRRFFATNIHATESAKPTYPVNPVHPVNPVKKFIAQWTRKDVYMP